MRKRKLEKLLHMHCELGAELVSNPSSPNSKGFVTGPMEGVPWFLFTGLFSSLDHSFKLTHFKL